MLKLLLIAKYAKDSTEAAAYLKRTHSFTRKPMLAGVKKLMTPIYYLRTEKLTYYHRLNIYNALYALDNEIWVNYLNLRLRTVTHDVVVEDPQYINEVNLLKEQGFIVVRIDSPKQGLADNAIPRSALPGTVMLAEMYGKSKDHYKVDYAVFKESRESLFKGLDEVVDRLRTTNV